MSAYPKYERYKDSGVEWLGEVPEHWEVSRSRRVFVQRKELARPGDQQLSATQAYGVIPQAEFEDRIGRKVTKISMHLEKRKHVEPDDFVISMRSFQGGLERAWARGCIRSSYTILQPSRNVVPSYFTYLLKSPQYIAAIQATGSFIRDGQDLTYENFILVDLPLPALEEQARIGTFLDRKTVEIDALIAKKQRQIELLDEQKSILINRAVTRGLNSNVKLKSSGIEWIGDIPEHWEVSSIRRQGCFVTSGSRGWAQYSSPSGPLFLRICNLSRGSLELKLEDIERVQPPRGSEGERTKVTSGDVLISITAFIGSIGVVPDGFEEAYVSQHIALVRIKPSGTHPKWIGYALLSELGAIQSRLMMYGGTKVGLSLGDVKNYFFPVPPQNEQGEILDHIAAVFSGYMRGVSQFQKEIQSLKTLRSTVIAHAVTGRIKVH